MTGNTERSTDRAAAMTAAEPTDPHYAAESCGCDCHDVNRSEPLSPTLRAVALAEATVGLGDVAAEFQRAADWAHVVGDHATEQMAAGLAGMLRHLADIASRVCRGVGT